MLSREVIWLLRGSQRKEVFLNIPENEFMPNKLRREFNKKLNISLSLREMSRHLRDFERKGFLKCINKGDPYNKIYVISEKGKRMRKILFDIENKHKI